MKRVHLILFLSLLLITTQASAREDSIHQLEKEDIDNFIEEIQETPDGKIYLDDTTKVSEISEIKDENGNVEALILNLISDNGNAAHFTLDVSEDRPVLATWGFGNDSESISAEITSNDHSDSENLYKLGKVDIYNFIEDIKETPDGKIYLDDTTRVDEIIESNDEQGKVNALVINLINDDGKTAYFTLDIASGEPIMVEWGFDEGASPISSEIIENEKIDGLYYLGPMNYLLEKDKAIYKLESDVPIDHKANDLESMDQVEILDIDELPELDDEYESRKTYPAFNRDVESLYGKSKARGGMKYNFKPLTMGNFNHLVKDGRIKDKNFCQVMAAFNLLRFYGHRRNVSNIMMPSNDLTMVALDKSMGRKLVLNNRVVAMGKVGSCANEGLHKYLKDFRKRPALGGDIQPLGDLWHFITININSGNPIVIGCRGKYSQNRFLNYHAVLALGYGQTSNGVRYYRVANGWDHDISRFVNSGYVLDAWYLRW